MLLAMSAHGFIFAITALLTCMPVAYGQLPLPTAVAADQSSPTANPTQYPHMFPDVFNIGGVLSTHEHRRILEQASFL